MISVAVVTYNGEPYIKEQLDSILANLGPDDEVIVSDDGSTDGTGEILAQYHRQDSRISVLNGPKKGVIANVDHALGHCRGDFIFLSDQDDVWMPDKVEKVMRVFREEKAMLVVHDARVTDETCTKVLFPSFFAHRNSGSGVWKNIFKNTYMGCCMAFRRAVLEAVCPIPRNIHMHDQWIGIRCDRKYHRTVFLPEQLICYRRHGDNVSELTHSGAGEMIKNRMVLVRELMRRK